MIKISSGINNCRRNFNTEQGYFVLMTIIVMSALLSTAILGFSTRVMFFRTDTLSRELKAQSQQLAQACTAHALVHYTLDNTYKGQETVPINDNQCTVSEISVTNSELKIVTIAQVQDLTTKLSSIVKTDNLAMISQAEIIN